LTNAPLLLLLVCVCVCCMCGCKHGCEYACVCVWKCDTAVPVLARLGDVMPHEICSKLQTVVKHPGF